MTEKPMPKKLPCRCEGCGKKMTRRQREIAKALSADKFLCAICAGKEKLPPTFSPVKNRYDEIMRKLRDK